MPEQLPGKRRFVVFGVVALALLISTMNLTVAFVILPDMQQGLRTSLVWVGWTITAYQLAQSVSMSLAGRISDRYGRRRVFLVALAVFAAGSAASALAPNIASHIFFRMVAALGGGAIMPVAAGIVSLEFPKHRAQVIGLFSSIMPMGWIVGPTFGGFVVNELSWRWAFVLPVPIALAALAGGWLLVRETSERVARRLDVRGALLLSGAIVCFMLALSLLRNDNGAIVAAGWALLVGSGPAMWLFWRHELRTPEPIVDLALLRLRPFVASNLYGIIWGGVSIGSSAFIPLYAQVQYGFDSARAGGMLIGLELALAGGSALTSILLLKRYGYRPLLLVGVVILTLSMLVVGMGWFRLPPETVPVYWVLWVILAIAGLGMGIQAPPSNNAGIELLPNRVSSIVGLRGMFRFAGSVMSTTVIFFVLAGFEDEARGIEVVYLALGLVLLLAIPLIFLMPTGREKPLTEAATRQASRGAGASAG
ncbi:MAG: MFS transporter [SAR202 cluster bacterium]|nr:MFS transporter [SAR202 cluster bacterium]